MDRCNLCGGTDFTVLEDHGTVQVVRCACQLVFVTPVPSRGEIEKTYQDDYYEPWKEQEAARRHIWTRRLRGLQQLDRRRGRLLDVGCGEATFLRLAQQEGWQVSGTELSIAAAAQAADLDVHRGEVWEVGLSGDTFDVVTSWHVIEHASDPKRMVAELFRLLRPGGWMVLATPNVHDYIFRLGYLAGRGQWPTLYEADERELHLFHFSAETLSRLVQAVGFTDVQIRFDRGAAAVSTKRLVNQVAYGWYRLTGLNWGIGLELVARKPAFAAAERLCA
ncbi:MAG: class I SAM-dependent methyltransferase [Nitrospirae bacterium]|nr:class I SAM-dependent methyltransferase [Nitrospirota bacterium]